MHIRSKDTVVVITGKDKGKEGKVLVGFPEDRQGRRGRRCYCHQASEAAPAGRAGRHREEGKPPSTPAT